MAEKKRLEQYLETLVEAIGNGIDLRMVKGPSDRALARIDELDELIAAYQEGAPPKPLVHPTMANRYRKEVENMRQALNRKDARAEASEHLRGLIGKIVLSPEPGRKDLRIDLHGDLAGILQIASQKQARPGNKNVSGPSKIALVAGVGFEPTTFGL
jgi:site-specific DNA recombinase